jgi:uncharacterized protein (DUF58 family)
MLDAATDYRKYLDPKVLAKIGNLELRARMIVEGFFSGMHHSPHRGLSIEFADHRSYVQGDDLRHIDWKLYGKTDKYYIKEYEQETNLNLMLVVDASESMGFQSDPSAFSKFEYAISIAAAISYLALQQHDSVGVALFDERISHFIRPSNHPQHWKAIVQEMDGRVGPAKTSMERVFAELAERLTYRTLIFIISDLFDDENDILRGLKLLRHRRQESVVFNLWDAAELTFPFRGPTKFAGLEGTGNLLTEPGSLRRRYLEEVERFQSAMRTGCGRLHIDYVTLNTSSPLDVALSAYLATRSSRIRHRFSRVMSKEST